MRAVFCTGQRHGAFGLTSEAHHSLVDKALSRLSLSPLHPDMLTTRASVGRGGTCKIEKVHLFQGQDQAAPCCLNRRLSILHGENRLNMPAYVGFYGRYMFTSPHNDLVA